MRDLFVYYDEGGSIDEFSKEARDFLRDPFQINYQLDPGQNAIYIGLYKPFNSPFFETLL